MPASIVTWPLALSVPPLATFMVPVRLTVIVPVPAPELNSPPELMFRVPKLGMGPFVKLPPTTSVAFASCETLDVATPLPTVNTPVWPLVELGAMRMLAVVIVAPDWTFTIPPLR